MFLTINKLGQINEDDQHFANKLASFSFLGDNKLVKRPLFVPQNLINQVLGPFGRRVESCSVGVLSFIRFFF